MKILTFSTLYPNSASPSHGIFVETRLRHLLESGRVEARVVAPVAWFPSRSARYGRYAAYASAPRREHRYGIEVMHPRYLSIPKVGMSVSPFLLAASAWGTVNKLERNGYDFDLIDAHYFYPDGVAAAMIGQRLNKPVVITARGSDLNLLSDFAIPRRLIRWAAHKAASLVTVSAALKESLVRLGVDQSKIAVLRNGVDTKVFRPADRASERSRLGLAGVVILMVGHLDPVKGHDLVLKALPTIPDATLLIIGSGTEEERLRRLTHTLNLDGRVRFLGEMPQDQLRLYYSAADVLVLASSREGWPNVLLEAMACGTPVVATRVGGTPEIVSSPEAGVLVSKRTPDGLSLALGQVLGNYPDRDATRSYAERFGWEETTVGQLMIFERVLQECKAANAPHTSLVDQNCKGSRLPWA